MSKNECLMKTQKEINAFIRQQRKDLLENQPLAGLRVVDMGTVVAAPAAAALLGDYGAEVIKVENPSIPDATRGWGIVKEVGIAPFWAVVGRNKFPITLNLKSDEGQAVFLKLIGKADVLISFRLLATPGKVRFPGLPHRSANEVILSDLLKYSDEQIQQMIQNEII